ncbi:hypothetical protein KC19_7G064100 [Ceratodon purpureus]|uniref:Uncharacterized protein n=1 Tax=Ceratodon purpureus TaxID=3225 RepID=A0A8T0HBF6_CERPU|nr:hypothetical protein KC19_7G064100 [Ceratodon purpureus]
MAMNPSPSGLAREPDRISTSNGHREDDRPSEGSNRSIVTTPSTQLCLNHLIVATISALISAMHATMTNLNASRCANRQLISIRSIDLHQLEDIRVLCSLKSVCVSTSQNMWTIEGLTKLAMWAQSWSFFFDHAEIE